MPVDNAYAHTTSGELIREHQPGRSGSDDEDVRSFAHSLRDSSGDRMRFAPARSRA